MKILLFKAERTKNLKVVEIKPNGDVILSGKNGQGKSSNLDALAWAVGGEKFRPTDPNRGMETAEIKVELSNGLLVERKGKNGALKITGGKNVQATLDDFVSSFAHHAEITNPGGVLLVDLEDDHATLSGIVSHVADAVVPLERNL